MDTIDDPTEDSALDLALHCVECDSPLTLTLDTPIGIRADRKTPGPLCSAACAVASGQRFLDERERCRCGEVIDQAETLLIAAGSVLGCKVCDWTGHASAKVRHYLSKLGRPICPIERKDGEPITATTDRQAVNCPDCRLALALLPIVVANLSPGRVVKS
jgi:hypothetical protein